MISRLGMILATLGCWLVAVAIFMNAKSAIHEIEALMFVLIGAVFCIGADVVAALDRLAPPSRAATVSTEAKKPAGDDLTWG